MGVEDSCGSLWGLGVVVRSASKDRSKRLFVAPLHTKRSRLGTRRLAVFGPSCSSHFTGPGYQCLSSPSHCPLTAELGPGSIQQQMAHKFGNIYPARLAPRTSSRKQSFFIGRKKPLQLSLNPVARALSFSGGRLCLGTAR